MPSRLETARAKEHQIIAKRKELERRERGKIRKLEGRKKLIIGSVILASIEAGEFSETELMRLANKYLKGSRERQFLGLETPAKLPKSKAKHKSKKTQNVAQLEKQSDSMTTDTENLEGQSVLSDLSDDRVETGNSKPVLNQSQLSEKFLL